jgi:SpoVK/Ycf46/Vps4 family AAA+-type ATPase
VTKLVTDEVFLRKLEYYKGVMFLTTNRVSSIDAAFESRIHMTFHYPDLTPATRKIIWKNLLQSSKKSAEIQEEQLLKFAEEALNGRQIKNVIKAAWLLADRHQRSLGVDDLKTIIRITKGQAGWIDNRILPSDNKDSEECRLEG